MQFAQKEAERSHGQVSVREFWGHVRDATGYTAVQVKQWSKPGHQRRLEVWLEAQQALRKK